MARATRGPGGAAITVDGLGSPFDGKYTVTTSRHRLDPSSYTTSFSVTGVRDRTLLGLTADGGLPATAPPGAVIAVVDDVNDPGGPAGAGCGSRGWTAST